MEKIPYNTFGDDLRENIPTNNRKKYKYNYKSTLLNVFVLCVSVFSFIVILSRNNISINQIKARITNLDSSSYSININVYSPDYGIINSSDDIIWDGIIEPYRNQILTVSSFTIDEQEINLSKNKNFEIEWNIDDTIYSGNDVNVVMNKTGVYDGTLHIYKTLGDVILTTYSQDITLAVKYVRREIRTLTDEDREEYFSALELLYSTDMTSGQLKYGNKFKNAEYFSYKHLTGAGMTDCDHWHDGAGIITHHMAFTLEFEQALQTINPKIAMPYWEYGMDTYLYDSWSDSPVFDKMWFGESSPINIEHKIDDGGRWVGIKVPDGEEYLEWSISDTGSLNPYVNGFGHMRSPWNNNPFQEIGRHNKTYSVTQYDTMPTCSTLQSCFKSDSLADINECSNGATHGPVHILIGGAWGEGELFNDEDVTIVQMPDKLLFFKVLWRMGYTRCPESCEYGTPCKCSVPEEYIKEYGAEAILKETNVYYALENTLVDADDELFLKILRAVEDPGIAGEMFSSAAAFDPSFWSLHGQIERLLGTKRIMVSKGEISNFDETWGFSEYNKASGAAYLNGKCDWSSVKGTTDLTLPTCELDVICSGHNENDVLEFTDFLNENEEYTNKEFYEFIHPWSDTLPYTYDTWDFDYCEEQGYSFTSVDDIPNENMLPPMPPQ